MTKDELIEKVDSGAGLSKADAARAITATLNTITSALKKGQRRGTRFFSGERNDQGHHSGMVD